jgi:archaeal flagellar protein FlaJ
MELKKSNIAGIILGLIVIIGSFFFYGSSAFLFILGVGLLTIISPFILSIIHENSVNVEKEEMFLEFSRNLVESVKTGTPVSKSILNLKGKYFGVLTGHIEKLANQISIGIPLSKALRTFSRDVDNKVVTRAITLIAQAEKEGGEIGEILEAVAGAVSMSDKLKKERRAAISSLVVQGYIIFVIFIIIILVMQFKILPMVSGIADMDLGFAGGGGGSQISQEEISNAFLYMLLIQGFFSGLVIGKLSEGTIKAGIKHSFALMVISFMISAIASFFFT